jgi:methylated-DNA-[protein]-cysteine S-methyltransferase
LDRPERRPDSDGFTTLRFCDNLFIRSSNQHKISSPAIVEGGQIMHDELTTFRTSFGWCAMLGRDTQLRAFTFGYRSVATAVAALDPESIAGARLAVWNRPLAARITAALEGEPDDFADIQIDLDHLTPFSRRVATFCRRIPWGQTHTYAQLAASAGRPGATRAVGRVMSRNRMPIIVPCHRVIGSSGQLVGFSAPQGIKLKRRLLAMESGALCPA